ncbi:unnamed protein product [Notodromas monacha]|uniref:Thioredoxin domain-containing protein n=1 Tax=Notodromas monacha TaxID=399045 RepID=A0A7R9GE02_9CRUS|nr:unnamed protein product [Notodromas monacha]CAG0917750.1 unnamed protein product [Notodromas monacha]
MAGFVRTIVPLGVFATTFLVQLVKAQDSYESLLYDNRKFSENVPEKAHFILFFAPWCGHCKRLMPTWEDLHAKYNSLGEAVPVTVARVDCTQESALCSAQGVTGYPTMKLFTPKNTEGIKYRGQRDLNSLEMWLKEQLGSDVKFDLKAELPVVTKSGAVSLTSENYHQTVKSGIHFVKFYAPWCSHCQRLAPVWDDLARSLEFDDKVNIAKVDCTESNEICQSVNVKGYPTLAVIKDGRVVESYNGERTLDMLKAFVDEMREKLLTIPGRGIPLSDEMVLKAMPSEIPAVPKDSVVVELSAANFENAVGTGVAFVKFYAPWCGHCKRLAPTWDDLAKKFLGQGNVRICKVDCTEQKSLCDLQEVEGYPTMLLYKDGKKVKEYDDKRDLDSLYQAVSQLLKDEL